MTIIMNMQYKIVSALFLCLELVYANSDFGGPNIAFGKTATQGPGDYEGGTMAGNAVNNVTYDNDRGTCAQTTLGTTSDPAWWQVDLGDTYQITGIIIYNRKRHAVRARLSGMKIEGRTRSADNFVLLYQDPSNITACTESMYGNEGTSPCDDVLLIPMSNTILFQFIKISVAHYLQLCEVQIFAEVCSLLSFDHGQIVSNGKNIFKSSEQATVTCDSNYAPVYTSITCQSDRSWSPQPSCIAVTCTVPAFLTGQYYLNQKVVAQGAALGFQSVITASCGVGYLPSPDTPRTCQVDGQWSGQSPRCTQIICDTENVRHSAIQHYPTLGIGETADVSYILSLFNLKNGSLQVECTAERKLTWIHQPYFEPICLALQVEHGFSRNGDCPDSRCPVGNTLRYICESGFTISSPTTTCQADHTWSSTPLCIEDPKDAHCQTGVIAGSIGWAVVVVLIITNVLTCVKLRRVRSGANDASKTSTNEVKVQNMQYTDLQENTRGSRDYTELQTRNDDYSSIDTTGHAYVNTQVHA